MPGGRVGPRDFVAPLQSWRDEETRYVSEPLLC